MRPNKRKAINIEQNFFPFSGDESWDPHLPSSFLPFFSVGRKTGGRSQDGVIVWVCWRRVSPFSKAYFAQYSVFSTQWWDKKGENEIPLGRAVLRKELRIRRSHMWDLKPGAWSLILLFFYAKRQFPGERPEKIQFQCLQQLQSIQNTTPKDPSQLYWTLYLERNFRYERVCLVLTITW